MAEVVGEYVDRLVTVEMRNRGMMRGVQRQMYDAARAEGGGRPLTLRAAEGLIEHVHRGDNVFFITGAGNPPVLPKGENDGPVGMAALARALYLGLGATPIFVLEQHHVDPVVASSETAGVTIVDYATAKKRHLGGIVLTAPADQTDIAAWAASLFEQYEPAAVICAERLGPNEKGIIHNATGQVDGPDQAGWKPTVDLSPVVLEAERRGVFSIGIGDAGNELGFGRIHSAIKEIQPYGARCQCPCGAGMATVIKTDVLVVTAISNWGCYGIEAMLGFLLGKPELMHSPTLERRINYACLDAGGLDGFWCTKLFIMDQTDGESSVSVVQILGDLVRIALAEPTTGPAH